MLDHAPLDPSRRQEVLQATEACLARAEAQYDITLARIPVHFDIRGRAAGMYRVHRGERCIRYNPHLFARYFVDNLASTVPHEVAHYVADMLYGLHRIKPHGREWRAIMLSLGAEPRATGHYDLTGIPVRRQRRFHYRCGCMHHELTTLRHNRVLRGEVRYHCRRCGDMLRLADRAPRPATP